MKQKLSPKVLAASIAVAIVSIDATGAYAQQLEEVVVTARKREESLQDVPVAVQALSADAIRANGTTTFQDLNAQISGLTIQNAATVSPSINLRGVTSDQTNVANDSAVSLNVDGIQHSSAQLFRFGLFDIESVEVLKGPQALFFGKNSPGGVVAIRTANPTDEFFSEVQVGYEDTAERMYGHVIVSGPLTDTWGARLGVKYTEQEGYFENTWGKGDAEAEQPFEDNGPNFDSTLIVGTLRGEFDSADVTFKMYHGQMEGHEYNNMAAFGACADVPQADNPYATCKIDDTFSSAPWSDLTGSRFGNDEPYTDYEMTQLSMDFNYEINDNWSFNNLIGWIDMDNNFFGNVGGRSDYLPSQNGLALGNKAEVESISEEFRFTGDYDSMRLMFGGYYDDRSTTSGANVWVYEFLTARPDAQVEVTGESWSVFGQAEFDLTETLALSVGARYTSEGRSVKGQSFSDYTLGVTYFEGAHYFADPNISFTDTSPEVTLSWRPQDNVNLFVSYKEGFKSGGYNASTQDATASNTSAGIAPRDNAYEPEEIEGYEFGFKLELLDNTLRLNGVAYMYEYSEMQLPVVIEVNGTPAPTTVNAGQSSIDGMEVDALWVTPWDALMVSANLAYNDATFDEYLSECSEWQNRVDSTGCGDYNNDGIPDQDRSGDVLNAAPEWSGSIGLMYDDALTQSMRLRANLTASYRDEQQLESFNDPRGVIDSYWIVNGRLGIYAEDESWAVDLIGRNLFDEIAANYILRGSRSVDPVIGGAQMYYDKNAPREVAIQFTFRPDALF